MHNFQKAIVVVLVILSSFAGCGSEKQVSENATAYYKHLKREQEDLLFHAQCLSEREDVYEKMQAAQENGTMSEKDFKDAVDSYLLLYQWHTVKFPAAGEPKFTEMTRVYECIKGAPGFESVSKKNFRDAIEMYKRLFNLHQVDYQLDVNYHVDTVYINGFADPANCPEGKPQLKTSFPRFKPLE